jgi:endoglucanase
MSTKPANPLPRWRGFNLLEKFSGHNPSQTAPNSNANAPFREEDFQWISDWGFDFVRLPMSYCCWSGPERWRELDEPVLEQIDQAIEFGRRYGVHVCLNFHRAPGYCINPPPEPFNLWKEQEPLDAFCHHWETFARRYRGIGSDRLSFDLVNEPHIQDDGKMNREDHERVIRRVVAAIRAVDAERLIIADGLGCGTIPCPEFADLGIAQSCRAYAPFGVSHYQAPWATGLDWKDVPSPAWPGGWEHGAIWTRENLEAFYQPWRDLIAQGVGVHCGEGGAFNRTPHDVFLAWFRDVLDILRESGIGFSLWNFRGAFGVLDSDRADVIYEDWQGHKLHRKLLELLREF